MRADSNPTYKTFLLTEYNNIAQAHFKSIETISNFFRYYLLLMSVPFTVAGVIYQMGANGRGPIANIVDSDQYLFSIVLVVVALVGLGVFVYIINLRLDVVLYARTVNAIRKQFYDDAELDTTLKLQFTVLPLSPFLPPYYEKSFFFPVVFVFAILDAGYILFSILMSASVGKIIQSILQTANQALHVAIPPWLLVSGIVLAFFSIHFLIYYFYARHRELGYLRSNIIGVDIDGVLNMHREHFCELLKSCTGKELLPEAITIIPVHEDSTSCVTREDERAVFNEPKYWTDMPVVDQASDVLRKLQNYFKTKIYIFTYRPWPDSPDKALLIGQKSKFWKACGNHIISLRPICWLLSKCMVNPIRGVTRRWLEIHKIPYDRLVIEKGNDYSSDPFVNLKNRFNISRKNKIRYFVEDDVEKAVKLSLICDVVFLISHPYNESSEKLPEKLRLFRNNLPSNIMRVTGWDEIYKTIRRFS